MVRLSESVLQQSQHLNMLMKFMWKALMAEIASYSPQQQTTPTDSTHKHRSQFEYKLKIQDWFSTGIFKPINKLFLTSQP